jgi:hypothetical protein
MIDPIASLQQVIDEAKLCRQWRNKLIDVRSIDESDERTFERLIRERQEICGLLRELDEPSDPFDHKYVRGDTLADRLRRHLKQKG